MSDSIKFLNFSREPAEKEDTPIQVPIEDKEVVIIPESPTSSELSDDFQQDILGTSAPSFILSSKTAMTSRTQLSNSNPTRVEVFPKNPSKLNVSKTKLSTLNENKLQDNNYSEMSSKQKYSSTLKRSSQEQNPLKEQLSEKANSRLNSSNKKSPSTQTPQTYTTAEEFQSTQNSDQKLQKNSPNVDNNNHEDILKPENKSAKPPSAKSQHSNQLNNSQTRHQQYHDFLQPPHRNKSEPLKQRKHSPSPKHLPQSNDVEKSNANQKPESCKCPESRKKLIYRNQSTTMSGEFLTAVNHRNIKTQTDFDDKDTLSHNGCSCCPCYQPRTCGCKCSKYCCAYHRNHNYKQMDCCRRHCDCFQSISDSETVSSTVSIADSNDLLATRTISTQISNQDYLETATQTSVTKPRCCKFHPECYRRRKRCRKYVSTATTNISSSNEDICPNECCLPYQHCNEYKSLVQELERKLIARNKERVKKTIKEFERRSRLNRNIENHCSDRDSNNDDDVDYGYSPKNIEEDVENVLRRLGTVRCCTWYQIKGEQYPKVRQTMKRNNWTLDPKTGQWLKESTTMKQEKLDKFNEMKSDERGICKYNKNDRLMPKQKHP